MSSVSNVIISSQIKTNDFLHFLAIDDDYKLIHLSCNKQKGPPWGAKKS